MKKVLMKIAIIGSMVLAGSTMTGCTDFERGLATGAAVGVAGTVIANENRRPTYSRSYYNRGYNNGCSSARGRWYKSSYYWRNSSSYRNGWRAGYRRCR
ncbi:MAG: hypothetical protein HF962_03040 [Sulfurovum sp.]|nr:hypothetical protein [Sulfurovum sp.]